MISCSLSRVCLSGFDQLLVSNAAKGMVVIWHVANEEVMIVIPVISLAINSIGILQMQTNIITRVS